MISSAVKSKFGLSAMELRSRDGVIPGIVAGVCGLQSNEGKIQNNTNKIMFLILDSFLLCV